MKILEGVKAMLKIMHMLRGVLILWQRDKVWCRDRHVKLHL